MLINLPDDVLNPSNFFKSTGFSTVLYSAKLLNAYNSTGFSAESFSNMLATLGFLKIRF